MITAPSNRRILGASLVGTAVEFYDFYIYATAASLVFGAAFFPPSDPGVGLLLSYATLAVAFVARPVGAIAFGHFGDRIGRKSTLVASLLLLFSVADRSLTDVLTSEGVAIEIARSAVGGIALALAVPLTTAVAAILATPNAAPTDPADTDRSRT